MRACWQELHLQMFDHQLCLFAHCDSVTCLQLCKPYSVFVSAAQDGTCVVWDLNRWTSQRLSVLFCQLKTIHFCTML